HARGADSAVWGMFGPQLSRLIDHGPWHSSSSARVVCCGHRLSLGPAAAQPSGSRLLPGGAPMTATTSSAALGTIQPACTDDDRLALAGFLAGYRGPPRRA